MVAGLPPGLVGQEAADRVAAAAARLPAALAHGPVGLEVRLAGPGGADLFAGAHPRSPAGGRLLASLAGWGGPVAGRLAGELGAWRRGEGWLWQNATFLLLEADASVDPVAVPSIFVAPRGAADAGPVERPDNAFHRDPEGLVDALAALGGRDGDEAAASAMADLIRGLPPFAEVFTGGAMLSRAAVAPRVVIRRLRPEGIAALLDRLARDAAARHLLPVARRLHRMGLRLALSVDVGPHAGAHAGIEASPVGDWTAGHRDGWAELLGELTAAGLADPDRARAAAAVPRPPGPARPGRGISHVKVTAGPEGLLPAKLYLGVAGTAALPAAA